MRVTRASHDLAWHAGPTDEQTGVVRAIVRPDRRCFLRFGACSAEAYEPLLAAVVREVGGDLHLTVDEDDEEARHRFHGLGFVIGRRESSYVLPTNPELSGLRGVEAPADFLFVSADRVDESQLRLLDDALRQDVPGTDGWRWGEAEFREETFGPSFDPTTYVIAVEQETGEYAGIVRVWNNPDLPRLGLIAVLAPYRRRGLARALLARTFAVLDARGSRDVSAEVDDENLASSLLLRSLGARRAGGSIEYVRRDGPT